MSLEDTLSKARSLTARFGICLLAYAVGLTVVGCTLEDGQREAVLARAQLTRGVVLIESARGRIRFAVEIADSKVERNVGLMHRRRLAADAGMIFLYSQDRLGPFWMKDTRIPLSVAFFDAHGAILRILDMSPCLADPCRLYRPGVSYRGALEVNRGAFAKQGVKVGDRLRLVRGVKRARATL